MPHARDKPDTQQATEGSVCSDFEHTAPSSLHCWQLFAILLDYGDSDGDSDYVDDDADGDDDDDDADGDDDDDDDDDDQQEEEE